MVTSLLTHEAVTMNVFGNLIFRTPIDTSIIIRGVYVVGLEVWSLYIDNSLSMNEELLVGVAEFVNMLAGGLVRHSVHYLQVRCEAWSVTLCTTYR